MRKKSNNNIKNNNIKSNNIKKYNIINNNIINSIILVISIYSIIGIILYIWFYMECREVYLS